MLHPTVTAAYVAERTVFQRALRMCFTLAGVYWFLLYALPASEQVPLRARQGLIYLVLLSLWGIDYMREQRRLAIVITTANALNRAPQDVPYDALQESVRAFTVMIPRHGGWGGFFLPIIVLAGITGAYILVAMQYVQAISSLMPPSS